MLLVFDNFEHLLATAVFVSDLLSQAPDIKIVVTSRERLSLQEEWLFTLQGLSFQAGDSSSPDASDSDAVQFFVQRARQVKSSFNVDAELSGIQRICQLVDGMPLGLELAAAWVFQLSCRVIAMEIEAEIGFLTTQMRNMPERHRSIWSVFAYSWEKLTPKEQDVFQKLSVFRGGFERTAAEAVAGASLPILASLTGKSLLTIAENGRYAIHVLLRQFAADMLSRSSQTEQETAFGHAHYFMTLIRDQKHHEWGPGSLAALVMDIDNMRVAIRWAVDHQPNLFVRSAARSLEMMFESQGWFLESEATFRLIVGRLKQDSSQQVAIGKNETHRKWLQLAHCQISLAWAQIRLGRLPEAEESIRLAVGWIDPIETQEAQEAKGFCSFRLGWIQEIRGEYPQALASYETAAEIRQSVGDYAAYGAIQLQLCIIARFMGDFAAAGQYLESAGRFLKDDDLQSRRLWNARAWVATEQGQLDEAEAYLQKSVTQLTEVGNKAILSYVWRTRADVSRLRGRIAEAKAYGRKGFALGEEINMPLVAAQYIWLFGNVAIDEREYEIALRYFDEYAQSSMVKQQYIGGPGWALLGLERMSEANHHFKNSLQLMLSNEAKPIGLDALVGVAHLKARAGQLEEALILLALVRHHPASFYEIREKARQLWEELAAELPAELVAEADARGREMDLWETAQSVGSQETAF
jgi:tetratricopeptide (TPR) repeat protein